jgi:hypothetical protein
MFDGSPVSLLGFEEDVDIKRKQRFDLPRDGKSGREKVKDEDRNGEWANETDGTSIDHVPHRSRTSHVSPSPRQFAAP